MTKYVLKRLGFGLLSVVIVLFVVMTMIYTMIDRETIFNNDSQLSKLKYNEKEMYKVNKLFRYGYLDYTLYGTFVSDRFEEKYGEGYTKEQEYKDAVNAIQTESTYLDNVYVQEFKRNYESKGYSLVYLPKVTNSRGQSLSNANLYAKRERTIFERMGDFFREMFRVETIWDVKDETLTDRYIRFEWDKRSNMPALVGSGTTHKYLIYFDNKFPFIHQNLIHFSIGKGSIDKNEGREVIDIMNESTGELIVTPQVLPGYLDSDDPKIIDSSSDFHSVTYNEKATDDDILNYGSKYSNVTLSNSKGLSRIGNSFIIGIIATVVAYVIGIPIGILMAKRKGKLADLLGNIYIIFIIAVPSLAYILIFSMIGTSLFKLPNNWSLAPNVPLAMVLPMISLALPMIGSLMKWVRRYMIDQQNADYVKFAKSQGLSKGEIFRKHISRNAFTYIVHSIPADLLSCLVGAIITERVYNVPGVGGMLTNAISSYDNGIILGATVFYTAISILAIILGDVLLAKYDPRVSFTDSRG